MPASFQEILNSRLFKFIVGEKADGRPTEFLVHEEAIAQLSKPLYSMMKGNMKESQAGCTIWEDVSKDKFELLAQFAYTGDYSVPKTQKRDRRAKKEKVDANSLSSDARYETQSPVSSEGAEEAYPEPVVAPEPVPDDLKSTKKEKKKGRSSRIWDDRGIAPEPVPEPVPEPSNYANLRRMLGPVNSKAFSTPKVIPTPDVSNFNSLSFPLLANRDNYASTCEPADHFDKDQSYSNVLLCHSSLYLLADFYLIHSLKALALYKLHKTLCMFQLTGENAEDLVDLVRYAYSEEGGEVLSGEGIGALRDLVCQYMAINALPLSVEEDFMDLLEEGGQFCKDFFKFVVQRKD